MPDYQKGKIYKLWSPSKNLVYYGSTTETLSRRLSGHLCQYKKYNNKISTIYVNSFKILECEDYKIELVEEYACNNRQQLCKKEGEYIKANECVNMQIAGRTKKEWEKENPNKVKEAKQKYCEENLDKVKEAKQKYRENNADKIKETNKKYNNANADKINERRRQNYLKQKELKKEKIETL